MREKQPVKLSLKNIFKTLGPKVQGLANNRKKDFLNSGGAQRTQPKACSADLPNQ